MYYHTKCGQKAVFQYEPTTPRGVPHLRCMVCGPILDGDEIIPNVPEKFMKKEHAEWLKSKTRSS